MFSLNIPESCIMFKVFDNDDYREFSHAQPFSNRHPWIIRTKAGHIWVSAVLDARGLMLRATSRTHKIEIDLAYPQAAYAALWFSNHDPENLFSWRFLNDAGFDATTSRQWAEFVRDVRESIS